MSSRPVWGWAETHSHLFAHLGFEGFFHGRPDSSSGRVNDALPDCNGGSHGRTFGAWASMMASDGDGHGRQGPRAADGWPKQGGYGSDKANQGLTHQQMYIDWIVRAYEGGLRLMVAHAVDSALMRTLRRWDPAVAASALGAVAWALSFGTLDIAAGALHNATAQRDILMPLARRTNDWVYSSIRSQIQGIKDFVGRHSQYMRVAYSPDEARQIILGTIDPNYPHPRIAVVLGIETDNLVAPQTTQEEFKNNLLPEIYRAGVRHLFPIHFANNWFGGSSIYGPDHKRDFFNSSNEFYTGNFWEIANLESPSPDEARDFDEVIRGGDATVYFRLLRDQVRLTFPNYLTLSARSTFEFSFMDAGGDIDQVLDTNPLRARYVTNYGHCNRLGLTENGRFGIRCLMAKGMIIDIDHMGHRTATNTIQIARTVNNQKESGYPVVAGHCTFRALRMRRPNFAGAEDSGNKNRTRYAGENDLSPETVDAIRDLGGIIGPVTNPHVTPQYGNQVPGDPRREDEELGSVRSFAQMFLYAIEKMGNKGVAVGTDFNGFNGKPRSMTVVDRSAPRDVPGVTYVHPVTGQPIRVGNTSNTPLQMSVTGQRWFSINQDGPIHYGMLPDMFQLMRNVGVRDDQLAVLFRSAEDYIQMWEKCERMSRSNSLDAFR